MQLMTDGAPPRAPILPRAPIDTEAFSCAMWAFAPFESEPVVAVAVSGGPDSLALLLLLDVWSREQGGSVLALTVDHALRPESAAEAAQVSAWAAARGIQHETLSWVGEKPGAGIQAAARAARYRLLSEACAARGILNLALAHHAGDQAETVLFRRERGSGPAGLAGMPLTRSLGAVRLIRPLMAWPKAALIDTCEYFDQPFFEDPSNSSERYARTALRRRLGADGNREFAALLNQAVAAATIRVENNKKLTRALGRIAQIRPDGVATIDRTGLAEVAVDLRCAALSAALRTTGGRKFAPDPDAVVRLEEAVRDDRFVGSSLAGCVIRLHRDRLLICREPRRAAPPIVLTGDQWHRWDGRFLMRLAKGQRDGSFTIGALGMRAYAALRHKHGRGVPAIVGAGLPALRCGDRLLAVPSIGWAEKDAPGVEQYYLPLWPLSSETFTVVYAEPDIMSL
jgi:tRNA(Ile)-lysidine synthase